MRVDGENLAAAPIERILVRLPDINRVAVYAVPDENVGDQVMAAVVLNDDATLTPAHLESFLAEQPDLSRRPGRVCPHRRRPADDRDHKVLKRELAAAGPTGGDGEVWVREPRGTRYQREG